MTQTTEDPKIVTCPLETTRGSSVVVKGTVSSCTGASATVSMGGAAITSTLTCNNGRFEISFDVPTSAQPGDTITVTITDACGNSATSTINVVAV